jgi:hypothetical protein
MRNDEPHQDPDLSGDRKVSPDNWAPFPVGPTLQGAGQRLDHRQPSAGRDTGVVNVLYRRRWRVSDLGYE